MTENEGAAARFHAGTAFHFVSTQKQPSEEKK